MCVYAPLPPRHTHDKKMNIDDTRAAEHLSGGAYTGGYARAVQGLPSLAPHQILGTMGTYSFGEGARVTIETSLRNLAQTQRTLPACPWHAALQRFLRLHKYKYVCMYTCAYK